MSAEVQHRPVRGYAWKIDGSYPQLVDLAAKLPPELKVHAFDGEVDRTTGRWRSFMVATREEVNRRNIWVRVGQWLVVLHGGQLVKCETDAEYAELFEVLDD